MRTFNLKTGFLFTIAALLMIQCSENTVNEKEIVMITEMRPAIFRERIEKAPVAYLPLGTIEWHGEHLPLGADGLQPLGIFRMLASKVGGVVYPMLFLGPDSQLEKDGKMYYGMDIGNFDKGKEKQYETRQFDGSSYWVCDTLYYQLLDATIAQVARAGFRILVAHGHGPSTRMLTRYREEFEARYNLKIFNLFDIPAEPGKGYMADHAAVTETSITMAFYPDLVDIDALPKDTWPLGVGGKDPRKYASEQLGDEIIRNHLHTWSEKLRKELAEIHE